MHIWRFCRFVQFLLGYSSLATLGTLFYTLYSVAVNENFGAENRFMKYWKFAEKLFFLNISEHKQYFRKIIFVQDWSFNLNYSIYFLNAFFKFANIFCFIFHRFSVDFSVSFQYFYKQFRNCEIVCSKPSTKGPMKSRIQCL